MLFFLFLLFTSSYCANYDFTNLKDAYISNVDCDACGIVEVDTAFGSVDPTILSVGEIYYDLGISWLDIGFHDSVLAWDISSLPTDATNCVGNLTLSTANGLDCPNEVGGYGGQLITLWEFADFTESTLTWNNKPATGSQISLGGSNSPYQDGVRKVIKLPLGPYVQSKRAGGATTVYLQVHTTNNQDCKFASKSHSSTSKRPTFSVTCS